MPCLLALLLLICVTTPAVAQTPREACTTVMTSAMAPAFFEPRERTSHRVNAFLQDEI
jgi:hypothetical protein